MIPVTRSLPAAGGAALEYAVGVRWPEGTDTTAYDSVMGLPDHVPEKHEMFAHLLLLAVRLEWREAERLREFERDRELRQRRRDERAKR